MTAIECTNPPPPPTFAQQRRADKAEPADQRVPGTPATCPYCGTRVTVRQNHTLGRHRYCVARVQYLCPFGAEGDVPEPSGRRVRVSVDAVVPAEWSTTEMRARVAATLREHLTDAVVVAVRPSGDITGGTR